ncbi:MAG TPA: Xaa-Pro peptidase family protein [Ramlibacter sp.]
MTTQPGPDDRLERLGFAMREQGISALVCARNLNVLLASGFWPVTGNAVAVITDEPRVALVVPEESRELARRGWADRLETFQLGSLERLEDIPGGLFSTVEAILRPLAGGLQKIGIETGPAHLPAAYASLYVYGDALRVRLAQTFARAALVGADELLAIQRMQATAFELERIRRSCAIAAEAYRRGTAGLREGVPETDAVIPLRRAFVERATREPEVCRADSFFYCMSGRNAAAASAAFQQSRATPLASGVPVLVHCNSYADGYWTDLTRTYVIGRPDHQLRRIFDALARARDAALAAIRPGVVAREVDRAARAVLEQAGFGAAFRHPLGHGVGFAAIDHNEPPRIHPASHEVLEEGMVFNVEPGVYIDGWGGARDCNMVAVSAAGCELLTPFQQSPDEWHIRP